MDAWRKSRWGSLLEKKNQSMAATAALDCCNSSAPPPRAITAAPQPPPQQQRNLVVSVSRGSARCPQCGGFAAALGADTAHDFNIHVFHCRLRSGVDPLLPVVSLQPRPPPAQPAQGAWVSDAAPSGTALAAGGGGGWTSGDRVLALSTEHSLRLPPAYLRPVDRQKLEERRPPRQRGRQPSDAQLSACRRANQLAIRRLLRARPPPRGDGGSDGDDSRRHLEELLAASTRDAELDLRGLELTPQDIVVLSALIREHPSVVVLDLPGRVRPELRPLLEAMLVDSVRGNRNIIQVDRSGGGGGGGGSGGEGSAGALVGPRCAAALDGCAEQALQAQHARGQAESVERLRRAYAAWRDARAAQVLAVAADEAAARSALASARARQRRAARADEAAARAAIERRLRRAALRARRAVARRALEAEEEEARAGGVCGCAAWQLASLETLHGLGAAVADAEALRVRRKLKHAEEAEGAEARERERARLRQEARARRVEEDLEEDDRAAIVDAARLEGRSVWAGFEEGAASIRFREQQVGVRRELVAACFATSAAYVKEEEEARAWINERRAMFVLMKEQERARARAGLVGEEGSVRVVLHTKMFVFMESLFSEIEAHMLWLRQYSALHDVERSLAAHMNQPPTVALVPNVSFDAKPRIYFVGPHVSAIEERVWVNTTSTLSVNLDPDWCERYADVLAERARQAAGERECYAAYNKLHQRNEKEWRNLEAEPLTGGAGTGGESPAEAADGGGGGAGGGGGGKKPKNTNIQTLKSKMKGKGAVRLLQGKAAADAASPPEAAARKLRVRGGHVRFSVACSEDVPPEVRESLRLTIKSRLQVECDGVLPTPPPPPPSPPEQQLGGGGGDEGSGSGSGSGGSEEGDEEAMTQWRPPETAAECFANKIDADGMGVGSLAMPSGEVLRVLLPSGDARAGGVALETIERVARGCRLFCEADAISRPAVVTVTVEVSLRFGGMVTDAEGETMVTAACHMPADVVLAKPFISHPGGLAERGFTEGMKPEELPLLPESFQLFDPPTVTRPPTAKKDAVLAATGFLAMPGGQQGQGLSLSNFDDAYVTVAARSGLTFEDVLCFKNTQRLALEGGVVKMREGGREHVVGEVAVGVVRTCAELNAGKDCTAEPLVVFRLASESNPGLLAAENVRHLLRSLRFANVSSAPVEGKRVLQVTVTDKTRCSSNIAVVVSVVGQDDPTEMRIPALRFTLRPSQVFAQFKTYAYPSVFPVAEGVTVSDVDTDKFYGGTLRVVLSGHAARGEGLGLLVAACEPHAAASSDGSQSSHASSSQAPALRAAAPAPADPVGRVLTHVDGRLYFDGHVIGRLTHGVALSNFDDLEPAEGTGEVCVVFSRAGHMSIDLCQLLLRSVVLATTRAVAGMRGVSVALEIGATVPDDAPELPDDDACEEGGSGGEEYPAFEAQCLLTEKLTIRHAACLVSIPEKYAALEYREGSGVQRLAPFELVPDKAGHVENYNVGWMHVEVVDGFINDEDWLAVREDETTKLLPRRDEPPPPKRGVGKRDAHNTPLGRQPSILAISCQLGNDVASRCASRGSGSAPGGGGGSTRLGGGSGRAPSSQHLMESGRDGSLGQHAADGGAPRGRLAARMGDIKERLREQAAHEAHERLEKKETLLQMAQTAAMDKSLASALKATETVRVQQEQRYPQRFDLQVEGRLIGYVTKESSGSLVVTFKAPGEGHNVTRKNVQTLLRNLTYANTSNDPQVLRKVIQVTLSDQPPCFSQCMFELNIHTVCPPPCLFLM